MDGGIIGNPEDVKITGDSLEQAIELLEKQKQQNLHNGAQLFVARKGKPVIDVAIGEVEAGIPLKTNSVMLWFSSTKPLTAVAIAQLFETGKLKLDDRVQKYIPEFTNGKETATIRQVLMHTGGFRMVNFPFLRYDWDTNILKICEDPAEWEPGTEAGYHPLSGWCILGEIVRVVDGRPVEKYLEEEIFRPLGMDDSSLGIIPEKAAVLGNRLSKITEKSEEKTNIEAWNDPRALPRILPGGNGYGPAHDLGKFYMALSNGGELNGNRILKKETVDLFMATHRKYMVDKTFSQGLPVNVSPPWGLGFRKGTDEPASIAFGTKCTSETYGHGGNRSSVGLVDPSRELVIAIVTNGLPSDIDNVIRLRDITDTIYEACY